MSDSIPLLPHLAPPIPPIPKSLLLAVAVDVVHARRRRMWFMRDDIGTVLAACSDDGAPVFGRGGTGRARRRRGGGESPRFGGEAAERAHDSAERRRTGGAETPGLEPATLRAGSDGAERRRTGSSSGRCRGLPPRVIIIARCRSGWRGRRSNTGLGNAVAATRRAGSDGGARSRRWLVRAVELWST